VKQEQQPKMKALFCSALAAVVAITGFSQAQSANKHAGDRERLIGTWHLAHIDSPAPDGKPAPQPLGMLIYTRDGHMSVQLMYPRSAPAQSNQYVLDGYEASFGSYDIDEATHTLTHHVQGSNTRDLLVGKDLARIYQLTADGHLIIRSARPEEHWSVTWEHY
jgi:Lipocalin-like domain